MSLYAEFLIINFFIFDDKVLIVRLDWFFKVLLVFRMKLKQMKLNRQLNYMFWNIIIIHFL
jgi:hypothetical protein